MKRGNNETEKRGNGDKSSRQIFKTTIYPDCVSF
jgi:hypothetical protein